MQTEDCPTFVLDQHALQCCTGCDLTQPQLPVHLLPLFCSPTVNIPTQSVESLVQSGDSEPGGSQARQSTQTLTMENVKRKCTSKTSPSLRKEGDVCE